MNRPMTWLDEYKSFRADAQVSPSSWLTNLIAKINDGQKVSSPPIYYNHLEMIRSSMEINDLEPHSCTGATVHKISFLICVFHVDHCPERIRWYYKIIAMQQLLQQNNTSMNRMAGTSAFIGELLSYIALHKFNSILLEFEPHITSMEPVRRGT